MTQHINEFMRVSRAYLESLLWESHPENE